MGYRKLTYYQSAGLQIINPDKELTPTKSKKNGCSAYFFGFNGKENDNEVKGTGNSVDFGARIYDPRIGRWMSTDPLQAKYAGLSPYNFCADNPIMFVEVDGRYFTGNTKTVKDVYKIICLLAASGDQRAIAFKAALEKMDESDVEFYIQNSSGREKRGGEGGMAYFDVENNRMVLDVYIFWKDKYPVPYEARAAHELKHGADFLEGEIGYKGDGTEAWEIMHDQKDEERAFIIQNLINNALLPAEKHKNDKDAVEAAEAYHLPNEDMRLTPEQIEQVKNSSGKHFQSIYNYRPTEKQKKEKKSILKDSQNEETPENTPNNEEPK